MKTIHLTQENQGIFTIEHICINRGSTNEREIEKMRELAFDALDNELTERQALILKKYYLENKKMPEIALELGITKQAVSKTVQKSIIKIKKSKKIKEFLKSA